MNRDTQYTANASQQDAVYFNMKSFSQKKVLLCVTGGIAAYKAVEIASRLRKAGAEVHVIMTKAATEFVTELTFREITGQSVTVDMWGKVANFHVEHIALAQLADIVIIAPATANILAKAAHGIADDMLTTTLLATKAPIYAAPAMNTNMYLNPITQKNISTLNEYGWNIISPESGVLACGTSGVGRLPEPIEILNSVARSLQHKSLNAELLKGKKVLITAAGTIEPIDPVRYIGNRSSGKMGYAIAAEAKNRGAEVVLVSGPSALPNPEGVRVIRVETAEEMRREVLREFTDAQIVIKAAAVADYRAAEVAPEKIKKNDTELIIKLIKNPDILRELGQIKKTNQILVGFAAETTNLVAYAHKKLKEKNLDFIVANDVSQPDAGFNTETNMIKILSHDGQIDEYPLMSKKELAAIILDRVTK